MQFIRFVVSNAHNKEHNTETEAKMIVNTYISLLSLCMQFIHVVVCNTHNKEQRGRTDRFRVLTDGRTGDQRVRTGCADGYCALQDMTQSSSAWPGDVKYSDAELWNMCDDELLDAWRRRPLGDMEYDALLRRHMSRRLFCIVD